MKFKLIDFYYSCSRKVEIPAGILYYYILHCSFNLVKTMKGQWNEDNNGRAKVKY